MSMSIITATLDIVQNINNISNIYNIPKKYWIILSIGFPYAITLILSH